VTHEAGHVVAAFLLGTPIRGVVLDAATARAAGLPGPAGTLLWDASLADGFGAGRVGAALLDAYAVVLFAGVAAEAIE